MNYPVWELGFGSGLLIAIVAVSHVYVSHFAIGGGFFLTLTEYYAVNRKDVHLLQYLKLHSRFFALLSLVYGALTGVGIWFTIGLINPAATSMLIHNFVWFWALEWIFFFIEVFAAVVYYVTWDRISQKTHFIVGLIYFISSFMSLVFINGILTFMLTPGVWIETHNVWDSFFNPTFMPSFFARISICIALAGTFGLLTALFIKEQATRIRVIRYAGLWGVVGIISAIPSYAYYYMKLPLEVSELINGMLPTSLTFAQVLVWSGFILLALLLIPVLFPRKFRLGMAVVFAVLAFSAFGGSEFIRESVRKPYVLYGYMYGNALRPDEYQTINEKGGILASSIFVRNRTADTSIGTGEDVFRIACRYCHAFDSYKGLRKPLTGLDTKFVSELIVRLERLRGRMPPFPGNDVEREALANYLISNTDPDARLSSGKEVFEKRCNKCHTVDGFRALYPLLEHHTYDSLLERIPTLGSKQMKMAPWSGTPEEAQMLAEYIMTWYKTGAVQNTGGR